MYCDVTVRPTAKVTIDILQEVVGLYEESNRLALNSMTLAYI